MRRLLKTAALSIVLSAVLFPLLQAAEPCHRPYAYLFSHDARFVKVDLDRMRLADVGNLWWLKINDLTEVVPGAGSNEMLVVTKLWRLLEIESPSRRQFDMHGIAVLHVNPKGELLLRRVIPPLSEEESFVGAKALTVGDEKRLYVTRLRESEDGQAARPTAAVYDKSYELGRPLRDFEVLERSCLSSDGKRLYTPVLGQPYRVRHIDLETGSRGSRPLGGIGEESSFSRVPVAFSDECLCLIYEKRQREGAQGTLHLYDYQADQVRSRWEIDRYADYHILPGGERILAEEKQYEPIVDESGATAGLQQRKPGRLSWVSGAGASVLQLPQEGRIAGFGCQGRRAYYLSPGLLSEIDLADWKVARSLEIPFREGRFAFHSLGQKAN